MRGFKTVRAVDRCQLRMPFERGLSVALLFVATAVIGYAQTDPWSSAAARLATAFTGPIAKGLALVAIVVGGLELAFSEGSHRRTTAGLIFGLGLALGATQFMTWLFF